MLTADVSIINTFGEYTTVTHIKLEKLHLPEKLHCGVNSSSVAQHS